jgi:hypothetical protein
VFTLKSLCIIISSIVIANLVRYLFIKYGIDSPLLSYPVLFSSAAGISSFLSIPSKLTIETLFSIISEKELDIAVGDSKVIPIPNQLKTTFSMVNSNNEGLASSSMVVNMPELKVNPVPVVKHDFSRIDNLLNELKNNIGSIHNQKLIDIQREIANEINNLNKVGDLAKEKHMPNYLSLVKTFVGLNTYKEFSDIEPVLNKFFEISNTDFKNPDEDLLRSNPVKY